MSGEQIKQLVESILNEKMELILTKIDSTKNAFNTLMEELMKIEDFTKFQIPQGLEMEGGSGDDKISQLHKFIKKISTSANQLNLINNMIDGFKYYSTRAALFLIRDDKLVGWSGKGFSERGGEISDNDIKKIFFSLSANTIFKYVLDSRTAYSGKPSSQPDDHLIYSRFGGEIPDSVFVLPFFVKGKPQAVIYTDAFSGQKIHMKEIEIIAITGEMSLDLLPMRQKLLARIKTKEFVEEEAPVETAQEIEIDDKGETVSSIKESDPERLARVIVNDIILYNQKAVEEGRRNKNLYQMMENTILQSKELYLNKYDNLVPFEKQLLENLAHGDREALRGYRFDAI